MGLYDLLREKAAINILKKLYDREVVEKKSYTMKLSEIKAELGFKSNFLYSIDLLHGNGLVTAEKTEKDFVLSITDKGKRFIEAFDGLLEVFKAEKAGQVKRNIKVRYGLTELEKKILVMLFKIGKEIGYDNVTIKSVAAEIYPRGYEGKVSTISRYIKRLQDLQLVKKTKRENKVFIRVTEKGLKTIKEQFLLGIMD